MYYVIKQQHKIPLHHFIGFVVEKYIASKNNDTIIFEFKKGDKVERKWVKKEDIILLTEDKKFFLETLNKFKSTEKTQQELIDKAKQQLEETIENFSAAMHEEIDSFNELKLTDDLPCIVKDY